MSDSLRPHGLDSPWNSPGQNTVGSLSLLQGIFPTQQSNPGLLHCRQTLYRLSHQGTFCFHGTCQKVMQLRATSRELNCQKNFEIHWKSWSKDKFPKVATPFKGKTLFSGKKRRCSFSCLQRASSCDGGANDHVDCGFGK